MSNNMSNQDLNSEDIYHCKNCKTENKKGVKYCTYCGHEIVSTEYKIEEESDLVTDTSPTTTVNKVINPELEGTRESIKEDTDKMIEDYDEAIEVQAEFNYDKIIEDHEDNIAMDIKKSFMRTILRTKALKEAEYINREISRDVKLDIQSIKNDANSFLQQYKVIQLKAIEAAKAGDAELVDLLRDQRDRLRSKLSNIIYKYTKKGVFWSGIASIQLIKEFFNHISTVFQNIWNSKQDLKNNKITKEEFKEKVKEYKKI